MRRRLECAARAGASIQKSFFRSTSLQPDWIRFHAWRVWEMLGNIKSQRQLTILITTHYMDEADRSATASPS